MVLQESRLQDFGGVAEVVLHFRQSTCREATRNLFSVLLDWAASKIEVTLTASCNSQKDYALRSANRCALP